MTLYGPQDVFIVIGANDLTPDSMELGDSVESMLEEVRPFGTAWDKHSPIGVGKAELSSGGGLYDDRAKAIIAGLEQKVGVRQLVAYGLAGDEIGADVTIVDGPLVAKFNRVADLGAITKANPEYVISGTPYRARVLHGRTEETADFDTEASSVDQATAPRLRSVEILTASLSSGSPELTTITTAKAHGLISGDVVIISGHTSTPSINGPHTVTVLSPTTFDIQASVTGSPGGTGGSLVKVTSPGGIADLHVTALTLGGHTALVVRVLHSADDITFAPLITFANVTASATTHAQRVSTSSAIQRYTAVDGDFTGAGAPSAVLLVALYRNA